jgi:hypothetical protein
LDAITNLHSSVIKAQSKANETKCRHEAEIEKGVLQLQLLTAKSDYEDLNARMGVIVKESEAKEQELKDTLATVSHLTKGHVDFSGLVPELHRSQAVTGHQNVVQSIRSLVAKLAASKKENEALLAERKYVWNELIEAKVGNARLHDQIEERDAKISKLEKALEESKLYGEEMWQFSECWVVQCNVAQDQIKAMEAQERIRADQRIWEDERDEYLREVIEERFGSLEKPSTWDDFMAFEHVNTLLDCCFKKGRYINRDHIPLTMRAVPWPVTDDPRWFFHLADIKEEKVESFLVKYHKIVANGDNVLYTRFLYMIRLIFDKDLWNPAQSLAGVTNPKGFMEAGAVVLAVVEAEIERLESRMAVYAYASPSLVYF